jgi:hypothetical protein
LSRGEVWIENGWLASLIMLEDLGSFMLEYLTALSLTLLVIAQIILLKKCSQFTTDFESPTGDIQNISNLLDEICDVLHSASEGLLSSPVVNSSPSSPVESILASFMSGMMSPPSHASQEPQEREIREIHPSPLQTENELD